MGNCGEQYFKQISFLIQHSTIFTGGSASLQRPVIVYLN